MSEYTSTDIAAEDGYRSVGGLRGLYANLAALVTKWVFPIGLLWVRWHVGWIFFKSGWAKFELLLSGQWDIAVSIIEETAIPGIPASITAPVTTFAELVLPLMLFFGVFARIGAGGLLIMALVIEFIIGAANPDVSSIHEHMIWMILAGIIVLRGPGWISLDHLLLRTEKN